jgi:hypothetical protein
MNYTEILGQAWRITWKHKVLWLFGILAGCSQGGGGGNQFNYRTSGSGGAPGGFPGAEQFERFAERPEFVAIVIALVVLGILIGLAVFVLSIIGRGGLIGGARLAEQNGTVTFGEAWRIGVRCFWRLVGIGLLVALPFLAVLILTVAGGVLTAGLGLICLLPLLCVVILALIPVGIVAHFAQFAVVIDDLRAIEAFRKGWAILKNNVGPILILGAILLVIGFIAGLILAAPFIALVIPVFVALAAGQGDFAALQTPLLVAAGLGFVCYLPILLVLSGILQTWTTSAWTLAYRHFKAEPAAPMAPAVPA